MAVGAAPLPSGHDERPRRAVKGASGVAARWCSAPPWTVLLARSDPHLQGAWLRCGRRPRSPRRPGRPGQARCRPGAPAVVLAAPPLRAPSTAAGTASGVAAPRPARDDGCRVTVRLPAASTASQRKVSGSKMSRYSVDRSRVSRVHVRGRARRAFTGPLSSAGRPGRSRCRGADAPAGRRCGRSRRRTRATSARPCRR